MIDEIVILAAGKSERFWPLGNKLLLEFLGKPFIKRQVDLFTPYCKRLWLVVSKEQQSTFFELFRNSPVNIVLQKEGEKGQAGAVRSLKGKIKGPSLIVNGNDFFTEKFIDQFFSLLKQKSPWGAVASFYTAAYFPGGYLKFDVNGRIIEVVEKPKPGKEPSSYVKAVFDYFLQVEEFLEVLEEVRKLNRDDEYEQALNILLKKHVFLNVSIKDRFLSLKYPWDALKFMNRFLSYIKGRSIHSSVKIGKNTVIEGDVIIEKGVKIGNFCKLKGPLYIGKNTIIGDFSMVRESHIGENVLVGGYTEVARSYLRSGVWMHRSYIGDSVIDKNVSFGAGSVTANLRFDNATVKSLVKGKAIDTGLGKFGAAVGEGAKFGVNSIILPGKKIGRNTFVGPGERVVEDLPDNKYLFKGKLVNNRL